MCSAAQNASKFKVMRMIGYWPRDIKYLHLFAPAQDHAMSFVCLADQLEFALAKSLSFCNHLEFLLRSAPVSRYCTAATGLLLHAVRR